MKSLKKLSNFKDKFIDKIEMKEITGGLAESTMITCQEATDPTENCPCGDIRLSSTFDGDWGSVTFSATGCQKCPA